MNTPTQTPETTPQPEAQTPYTTPQLEKLGDVKQVTEGSHNAPFPDTGGLSL